MCGPWSSRSAACACWMNDQGASALRKSPPSAFFSEVCAVSLSPLRGSRAGNSVRKPCAWRAAALKATRKVLGATRKTSGVEIRGTEKAPCRGETGRAPSCALAGEGAAHRVSKTRVSGRNAEKMRTNKKKFTQKSRKPLTGLPKRNTILYCISMHNRQGAPAYRCAARHHCTTLWAVWQWAV